MVPCFLGTYIHTSACGVYTTCHPDRLDAPMCTTFLLARCQLYSMCPPCREALDPAPRSGTRLEQQWNWLGNSLRNPSTSILHQVLVNLIPTSGRDFGHRHVHGPTTLPTEFFYVGSGTSRLTCHRQLASRWLCRFGVPCRTARQSAAMRIDGLPST